MIERLAFGSNAFTDGTWTLENAIRAIAKEGYAAVNILADSPLLWPLTLTKTRLRSIQDTLKDVGLVVSGVNGFTAAGHYGERMTPPGQDFGPSFTDKKPKLRALKVKYTKQVIDLTERLDVRDISIGSGYCPEYVDPNDVWNWMVEAIAEALEYAEERGINLNIEFEPSLLISGSDDANRLLHCLPSDNLGINFDIGHSFVEKENVPDRIQEFGDKIKGADIEDIGLNCNGEPEHFHLVPGKGVMPLERIFSAFQDIGFENRGYYTVELYSQSDRPIQAARESMHYFRRLEEKLCEGEIK